MRPSPLALPVRRTHAIRPSFGELHAAGSVASSSIAYACNSAFIRRIASGRIGRIFEHRLELRERRDRKVDFVRPGRRCELGVRRCDQAGRESGSAAAAHVIDRVAHEEAPDERGQSEVITVHQEASTSRKRHLMSEANQRSSQAQSTKVRHRAASLIGPQS